MEMTVANLQRHVDQLSGAFEIVVVYNPLLRYEEAGALRLHNRKAVIARPITCAATYSVVMHEFGHHLAPNGYCNHPKPRPGAHPRERFEYLAAMLVAEEAAWEWARYYIEQMFYWTAAMEQVKQYAFGTYQHARRMGQ